MTPFDRVQARREALGISQRALCRRAGLDESTLAQAKRTHGRVQARREALGISQRALCRRAGLDESTLAQAKRTHGRLDLATLQVLAAALDCPLAELLGEAPPPYPGAAPESTAPFDRIHPSPLNPRKRFDPEALDELAQSIAAEGVLLPLLVRRHPAEPGAFEIIAGERRWRAAGSVVAIGARAADWPLPIRLVEPCPDRKLIELALTENVARRDMTPLEEAEAFAALVDQGATAAEIARTVGMVARTVQKRLRLVRDLAPEARQALAEGRITVEQANLLAAYCPAAQQQEFLAGIDEDVYGTTPHLKDAILRSVAAVPVDRAFFKLDLYDGPFIEDEDEGRRYFADRAQFQALQEAAIEAKHRDLEGRFAWAKVVGPQESFPSWQYETRKGDPNAGAVLDIGYDGIVKVREHLVLRPQFVPAEPDPPAAKPDPEPVTRGHYAHARRRKTEALQAAIARDPAAAMRLACLALLGETEAVRIRAEAHDAEDQVAAPLVVEQLARHESLGRLDVTPHRVWAKTRNGPALWRALAAMPPDELEPLFAALVALRCGTFNGYNPGPGDSPTALAVAETLGLAGAEAEHGLALVPEDLDGLRKATLHSVARDAKVPGDLPPKLGELKGYVAAMVDGYVLPTLRFATPKAVEAAIRSPGIPATQAAE